jgi:membrane-associated protein
MDLILEIWRALTNPEELIRLLGTVLSGWIAYALLAAIVFAETGLLAGFFFPGDSLLFTVGVVLGAGKLDLTTICVVLVAAAILGDQTGYLLGLRTGPRIFDRPDSRFFKRAHLDRTQAFYEKHGGKTIIYARFVPIIRTFAPFVAGVARMGYRRFVAFNVFGGIGWVLSMVFAGYYLGGIPIVRRHFEKVVILIVLVSVLPIVIGYLRHRANERALQR